MRAATLGGAGAWSSSGHTLDGGAEDVAQPRRRPRVIAVLRAHHYIRYDLAEPLGVRGRGVGVIRAVPELHRYADLADACTSATSTLAVPTEARRNRSAVPASIPTK